MSSHRDRHARGLRGPLARPRPGIPAVPLNRARNREAFFTDAVAESVARVARRRPEALSRVQIGWEEVPHLEVSWSGSQVPLAAAIEATEDKPARVVIYRRPLELRAATPRGLKILVHRTVIEQLSALTGIGVDDLDPEGYGDAD